MVLSQHPIRNARDVIPVTKRESESKNPRKAVTTMTTMHEIRGSLEKICGVGATGRGITMLASQPPRAVDAKAST